MPEILNIIWAIFLIVVFFGGSIFVHEFGHYLAARKRGLAIERFSIGFGPKIWSTQIDGVEWCVSLFPLGGYVALPQLANLEGIEGAYDENHKALPPISYTDTLTVAVMGVVFNMIFAFVLACILWGVGRPSTDSLQTTHIGQILEKIEDADDTEQLGPGLVAGLLPGDKILSIDGEKVSSWREVRQAIVTGVDRDGAGTPRTRLTIERAGQTLQLAATPLISGPEKLRSLGLLPEEELLVGRVFKNSPAEKAGIQNGDQILSVNSERIRTYYAYATLVEKAGTQPLQLEILRDGQKKEFRLSPQQAQVGRDGKTAALLGFDFAPKIIILHEDPFTQIGNAVTLTWRTLVTLVYPRSDIKLTHLSGPPGIAWFIYRLSSDLRQLLSFIVIINVNLAILNLLPLPVLDGGHIVLATIEKIRKKPVPAAYVAVLQNIFTFLLLGLMVYIMVFADLPRLRRDWKEQREIKKELKNLLPEPIFDIQTPTAAQRLPARKILPSLPLPS